MKFPFFRNRNNNKLSMQVLGSSDIGLKRSQNQDSFFVTTSANASGQFEALLIVADGMGGLAAGEVASEMAVAFISEGYKEQIRGQTIPTETLEDRLSNLVREANARIYSKGTEDSGYERGIMGTTCTVGIVSENSLYIAHAGDSRAYLLRNKQLLQLTTDDSWVMDQVAAGHLTKSQAKQHPNRNIVTQALGINQDLDVEDIKIELQAGDRLILCSDGLHGLVDDEKIKNILMESSHESVINDLIESAKIQGGHDNITVVIGDISIQEIPSVS